MAEDMQEYEATNRNGCSDTEEPTDVEKKPNVEEVAQATSESGGVLDICIKEEQEESEPREIDYNEWLALEVSGLEENQRKESSSLTDTANTSQTTAALVQRIIQSTLENTGVKKKKPYKRKKEKVPWECERCGKKCVSFQGYKVHYATHTKDKRRICEFCNEVFKRKTMWLRHVRGHTGETPFSCEVCKRSFKMRDRLVLHMRVHTNERPYPCKVCNKAFKKTSNLRLHELTHVENKPFMCEVCAKSFRDRQELMMHIRNHTGEAPFRCDTCGKTFRKKNVLMVHTRIHTGALPYQCSECKLSFRHKYQLDQHLTAHAVLANLTDTSSVPLDKSRDSLDLTANHNDSSSAAEN